MELKIEKKDLVAILARAVPAAAVKSPMAMLTCVLLSAEPNGRVTASGTDLVVGVIAETTAVVKTPGAVAVNARGILDIAKNLPFGEVTLAVAKDRLEVKMGKSRFKVPFAPAAEYPALPLPSADAARLSVSSKELGRMLKQSMYARSEGDESRAFIACVRVEHSAGVVQCIATDSNRLALSVGHGECPTDWADQINHKALGPLKDLCGHFGDEPVAISTRGGLEGYVHFQWHGVTLSAKSAGSNFIPWRKLVEAGEQGTLSAECVREELIECIKRASLVLDNKDEGLRFEVADGQLTISSETSAKGSAHEQMDVDYAGKPFVFGMRAAFMLEALSELREDVVRVRLNAANKPVLIEGVIEGDARPESLAVLMPYSLPEARS